MRRALIGITLFALVAALSLDAAARFSTRKGPALAHMVFFTLKDQSPASVDAFVASCKKLLSGHEGCVYFSVGTRADDVDEPVSVKDFDVAVHVVFDSREAKMTYLKNPRHDQFVAENKDFFATVRVFDSYLVEATD